MQWQDKEEQLVQGATGSCQSAEKIPKLWDLRNSKVLQQAAFSFQPPELRRINVCCNEPFNVCSYLLWQPWMITQILLKIKNKRMLFLLPSENCKISSFSVYKQSFIGIQNVCSFIYILGVFRPMLAKLRLTWRSHDLNMASKTNHLNLKTKACQFLGQSLNA